MLTVLNLKKKMLEKVNKYIRACIDDDIYYVSYILLFLDWPIYQIILHIWYSCFLFFLFVSFCIFLFLKVFSFSFLFLFFLLVISCLFIFFFLFLVSHCFSLFLCFSDAAIIFMPEGSRDQMGGTMRLGARTTILKKGKKNVQEETIRYETKWKKGK